MTDTEILDWMQQNATGIHEDINERMTVTWLDKSGIPRITEGENLRDCVRGAMADANSRKDAPPIRKVRHELDRFKPETDAKSLLGECEGGCEEHYGIVKTVRVFDKKSGADWGYFSYCEAAIQEDVNRGMEIENA